jgi:hypothetical protein
MNAKHEADAARVSEMLFVDASVDDLATILGNLRGSRLSYSIAPRRPRGRSPWPCTAFAVSMPSM